MVTDTTRNKILLFAGMSDYKVPCSPRRRAGLTRIPMRNEVWKWDGSSMTWTKSNSHCQLILAESSSISDPRLR